MKSIVTLMIFMGLAVATPEAFGKQAEDLYGDGDVTKFDILQQDVLNAAQVRSLEFQGIFVGLSPTKKRGEVRWSLTLQRNRRLPKKQEATIVESVNTLIQERAKLHGFEGVVPVYQPKK